MTFSKEYTVREYLNSSAISDQAAVLLGSNRRVLMNSHPSGVTQERFATDASMNNFASVSTNRLLIEGEHEYQSTETTKERRFSVTRPLKKSKSADRSEIGVGQLVNDTFRSKFLVLFY